MRPRLRDLLPVPAYRNVPERIDHADEESEHDLRGTLRDLGLVNRLGGTAVVLRHLETLTAGWPADRTLRVLDVATGLADIPVEIVRWARRRGIRVEIVATDVSPRVLEVARGYVKGEPSIRLEVQDARRMPYPDESFDVVTCSLALHHLERHEAVDAIREMARLSKIGFIANDVERCLGAYAAARLAALSPFLNPLTRHDGPNSVVRAFTASELKQMAREAGVLNAEVHRHAMWRQALVGRGRG